MEVSMRIAVADDDRDSREFVSGLLTRAGYNCACFADGRDLVAHLRRETYDLLLLDWNMPGMTAIDVIDWVRQTMAEPPKIIVLTSRSAEQDIIEALDRGADDFITKPSGPGVIRARVAANLRKAAAGEGEGRLTVYGRYCFDALEETASFDGQTVKLTAKEFALALLLFDNLRRPLSRTYILQRIWNNSADLATRTLDMHVSRLRTKLCLRPQNGYQLQTVFGYGYRLDAHCDENPVAV